MPLNGAPQQRIYPESGPTRTRSPAYQGQDRAGHLSGPTDPAQRAPLPIGQASQPHHSPAQKTPFRQKLYANNSGNYDGAAERHNQMPMNTLKQRVSIRAGSEPRRPFGGTASNGDERDRQTNPPPIQAATGMKVEVPDTLRPTAPPMKHQTSQSSDASVQEQGREERRFSRESTVAHDRGQPFPPHHYVNESEDVSVTFDQDNWNDFGDDELEQQGEPTALLRGHPVPARTIMNDFVSTIGPGEIAAAWAGHANDRGNSRGAQPAFGQAIGRSRPVDETGYAPAVQSAYETDLFAAEEDKADILPHHYPYDGETPSKPPSAETSLKRRSGKTHMAKKVNIQEPEQMDQRGRESSPIEIPTVEVFRNYGKEHLQHYQEEQAQKQEAMENRPTQPQAATVSKVPESQETSEDERPTPAMQDQPNKKRALDQTDYEIEKLKTMSYADLDSAAFLTDPRARVTQPAVDASGTPITLEQRLSNLPRMNIDDQKSLFRSLSDGENEDVGQWFMQTFADDLKRLMEVRLERRKKALTYEMEAKKRQKEVEVKTADLETDLGELKKGGSQLIEGRSSPRPPRAG